MHPRAGFTLVELSIVLVIIGLLIGGILGGQELIRASELNSVAADANRYKVAVNAFRLKYNAIPGDMVNATAYWGAVAASCPTAAGTGTQTCNGDGDGYIEWAGETFRAWQHLSNSGIVPGNMAGSYVANVGILGTNLPTGKITGTGFAMVSHNNPYGYSLTVQNRVIFGTMAGTTDAYTYGNALTPADAQSIDIKADDGLPVTGKVIGGHPASCSSGTTSAATYLLSSTSIACSMTFEL